MNGRKGGLKEQMEVGGGRKHKGWLEQGKCALPINMDY